MARIANITANGSSITSGNGVLLNTLSSGTTTLTASGSQLTGAVTTDSTSTANITLQGNTTWTMTGSSNLTNLINDPSTIVFTPPTGDPTLLANYKTLSAVNYTGLGGHIALNTYLGGDGSPSDRLIINGGSASGSTTISVTNQGGPGALTVANGIQLVQAVNGGTTTTDAFHLTNGFVDAGLFEYSLFRGGLNGSSPDNWFLRSDFVVPPSPPTPPPTPEPTPSPDFPVDPPPDPLPPGTYPIIGPRLATYGVVQPIARELGLAMLGTLHERIGDTLTVENADPYAEGWGQSSWARFFGEQVDKRYQAFVEPTATGRELGVQAGFDIWRGSFIPGHHDAAGVYFAYGNGAVDVNGLVTNPAATGYVFANTGNLNLQAYSGGAYWTHYGPGGWYLDAVLQGTAYTGDATTVISKLPTDGAGFVASLEGGYPIPLPLGPNFKLEPQAQIIYQHVGFHDAFDNAATIGLGTTSGATGRLGVRGQWTINTEGGQVWQPYVRANVWHNWGGEATLTSPASAISVPLLENTTWLEFAGGLTFKANANLSFYGQFGGEFAVAPSNARYNGVKGDIGVRWTFNRPPPPLPAPTPVAAPARTYLVFFDWDKATLTDRARQIIREAADNSTHVQYTRIAVNGYTDTSGTPRYNQGLSVRRAEAVAAELVRDGVPRNVITIEGFGETHLLVPTGPGVREPQNRRVEIVMQ